MDGSLGIAIPRGRRRVLDLLRRWRRRADERRKLAQFDDRQLADIGITRFDRARECAKPFWRP